jgi:hypothetical protein
MQEFTRSKHQELHAQWQCIISQMTQSLATLPQEPQMLYYQHHSKKYDVYNTAKILDPTG